MTYLTKCLKKDLKNKFGVFRNTYYISDMKPKEKEKRVGKSYKVKPSVYAKARKKAKAEKTTVANVVEELLYDYVSR